MSFGFFNTFESLKDYVQGITWECVFGFVLPIIVISEYQY